MEAALDRVHAGGHPVVEVMIPLTVSREELALARSWVEEAIAATTGDKTDAADQIEVAIGTMIETPEQRCRRRDRRVRGLLLLRHERPDPDDVRFQP